MQRVMLGQETALLSPLPRQHLELRSHDVYSIYNDYKCGAGQLLRNV